MRISILPKGGNETDRALSCSRSTAEHHSYEQALESETKGRDRRNKINLPLLQQSLVKGAGVPPSLPFFLGYRGKNLTLSILSTAYSHLHTLKLCSCGLSYTFLCSKETVDYFWRKWILKQEVEHFSSFSGFCVPELKANTI